MRVRVVNTGTAPVAIPITPAQAQLDDILARAEWTERLHTGETFPQVLTAGERASYPVKRFTSEQLAELDALNLAGKLAVFVE